jgi:hypothetical protein
MAAQAKRPAKAGRKRGTGKSPGKTQILREVIACLAAYTGRPKSFFSARTRLSAFIQGNAARRAVAARLAAWPALRDRGLRLSPAAVVSAERLSDLVPLIEASLRRPDSASLSSAKKKAAARKPAARGQASRGKKAARKAVKKKPAKKSAAKTIARKKAAGRTAGPGVRSKKAAPKRTSFKKGAAKNAARKAAPPKRAAAPAPAPAAPAPSWAPPSLSPISASIIRGANRISNFSVNPFEEELPRRPRQSVTPKRAAPSPKGRPAPSDRVDRDSREAESSPAVASTADALPPPRYANAVLLEEHRDIPIHGDPDYFAPDMLVRLRLDIGELSAESQVENPEQFPAEKLPADVDLDVMVSSTDFGVALEAESLKRGRPSVAHGYFFLPGDGGPARTREGKKELFFFLKLPPDQLLWFGQIFHARIGYYYRNILIQSQHLTVSPANKVNYTIVTDFTTSDDLTGLDVIPERPRVSILTNANGNGNHQIVLRRPGEASSPTASGVTLEMNATTAGDTIRKLRKTLTDLAPQTKLRNAKMFAEDLKKLAPIGWDLYSQLPGQVPADFFGDLQLNPDSSVIQVDRPTTSSFVLPWSFMYEIPLYSGVTPTLCPMVAQWDGKAPLFADAPRQCPHGPHDRDVLCPFGFWGYRYAIEQLSSSDKPVLTIPAASNFNVVVGETQYGIDLAKLNAHVVRLRDALGKMPLNARLQEGKDKATIETLLGADLPFVYFYCHGERLNVADPNTYLGVGSRETITAQDIIGWTQGWFKKLKRLIWSSVRPLVFINACHTLAIEPETLVTYLQAFVGRGRAAGVIGTEVKVDQFLAMDVAEQFVAAWLSGGQTVEQALRAIRIDYLKQGNLLGLVYTPYCWSELKIVKQ